jgi:acyl-CoA synthetase (AMP-forming)/AMP-acid ligase II
MRERTTVPALLRVRAAEQPEKAFVVTDDAALTYGELDQRSAA